MKLSAVSQTASEIVPRTQPTTMNSFGSSPEVVVISPSQYTNPVHTSACNKKTSFKPDSDKHYLPNTPTRSSINIQTICVAMEDAACCTDMVCKESCSSQTEVVKCCERSCGSDYQEMETKNENSNQNRKKVCIKIVNDGKGSKTSMQSSEDKTNSNATIAHDRSVIEIKRCRCPKKKHDDSARSKNDDDSQQGSQKTRTQKCDGSKKDEKGSLCSKCRSKSNNEMETQCDMPMKINKKCGTSDDDSLSGKSKKSDDQEKPYTCRICLKGVNGDHAECVDWEDVITDIYKNNRFDDSKMNRMPVEVDLSQTLICSGCNIRNSVSLMNIDSRNEMVTSKSESSSRENFTSDSSSSSYSLCKACRTAEKSKMRSQLQNDQPEKTDSKMELSDSDFNKKPCKEKQSKGGSQSKPKQTKGRGRSCRYCLTCKPIESKMSVKECGTSTGKESANRSDACQTNMLHLKDECVQCISVKYKNASVDTDEELCNNGSCSRMSQTDPEEPKPSITQSIRDFVTRYVWGDQIMKDCSTQSGNESVGEESRCFVWHLQNGMLTPMETDDGQHAEKARPKLKDSYTQMDVDDLDTSLKKKSDSNKNEDDKKDPSRSGCSKKKEGDPNDNQPKNILKKSDVDNENNCKNDLTNKRSVVFNPNTQILEKHPEDAQEAITIVEYKKASPSEEDTNENEIVSRNEASNPSVTNIESIYFGPDESFDAIENGLVKEGTLVTTPEPQENVKQEDDHENSKSDNSESSKKGKFKKGKSPSKLSINKS